MLLVLPVRAQGTHDDPRVLERSPLHVRYGIQDQTLYLEELNRLLPDNSCKPLETALHRVGGILVPVDVGYDAVLESEAEQFMPAHGDVRSLLNLLNQESREQQDRGVRMEGPVTIGKKRYVRVMYERFRADDLGGWLIRGYSEFVVRFQARGVPPSSQTISRVSTELSWYKRYHRLYKFSIQKDGIAKFKFDELALQQPGIEHMELSRLRIIHRGQELPFLTDPDTATLFGPGVTVYFPAERAFADRLRRESDAYQVEGVYWIGEALDPRPFGHGEVPLTIPEGDTTARGFYRWENRNTYHGGNGSDPVRNQTADAPGRGWYSARIRSGQVHTVSFDLPGLTQKTIKNASLTVRLVSSTAPQNPLDLPDHRIVFTLNGTTIADTSFFGYQERILKIDVPSASVMEMGNSLRLTSQNTGASINEVLLDYFLVDYDRDLFAHQNRLSFRAFSGQQLVKRFEARGFTSPLVALFRYTAPDSSWSHVAGMRVTQEGSFFRLSVQDTIRATVEYVAVGMDSAFIPTGLRLRGFEDLSAPSNEADYILLTTDALLQAGEELASFRSQTRGVRSRVLDVEQVFDQFDFGYRSPHAIKKFFTIARTQWGGEPPGYAVLLGAANWDARGYSSARRPNLLPSFGNPVSDVWLTTIESLHEVVPQLSVGRIPARTMEEADRYIRYLREYEAYGPTILNKYALLLTGGVTHDENTAFAAYMESLAGSYVEAFPFAGIPKRVYKKTGAIEFEEGVEIRNAIEEGATWISFFGHAASTTWDNAINSPRQLRNAQRRKHIISDLSCSTNKFAEPDIRCFGEEFLFDQEDAGIAFLGSTGLGFISALHEIGRSLFRSVFRDTIRVLGDAVQQVRADLWKSFGSSLVGISTIQQYALLGDPLIRIAIPTQPDLVVEAKDVRVDKFPVTDKDTAIAVIARVQNFGLGVQDSVHVRLRNDFGGTEVSTRYKSLPRLGTIDSVTFLWNPAGKGGEHTFYLDLDPSGEIPDQNRTSNSYQFTLSVLSNEVAILRPLPFSTSSRDSVLLSVNVPALLEPGSRLEIQIDTARAYRSPTLSLPLLHGGIIDYWGKGLADKQVYYWRVRLVGAAGATSWTEQVFYTEFSATGAGSWSQNSRTLTDEFNGGTGVQFDTEGVRLKRGSRSIVMKSAGFVDGNIAEIVVDGFDVLTGIVFRGLNTVRFDARNGNVLEVRNFDTWGDSASVSAMASYVQALSTGQYLAVAAKDEASRLVNNTLRSAMLTLGAVRFDTLRNRDAYLLLGRKGAAPGSVPESLRRPGGGIIEIQGSAEFKATEGSVRSPWIGPASLWKSGTIELNSETSPDSVRVLLEARGAGDTLRLSGTAATISSLLTSIPPVLYPFLRISATFAEEHAVPGSEPELRAWSVAYEAPAELALAGGTITVTPDRVDEGIPVQVMGKLYNGGYSKADSVVIELRSSQNVEPVVLGRLSIPQIVPFQKVPFVFSVSTRNLAGRQILQVVIDPEANQKEFLRLNNSVSREVTILRDSIPPTLTITVDGIQIMQGDYVSAEPEILIHLIDAGPLPVGDTTALKVFLDGAAVSYSGGALTFESGSGELKARARYTPILPDGDHLLRVTAFDASGNGADSSSAVLRFRVQRDAKLLNIVNYPNPFSSETRFTFNLAGSTLPDRVKIRVYTVVGRLVQELEAQKGSLQFGFNIIPWDGRDREGAKLANGTYFYKVIATTGNEQVERVERLAIIR
ncbi:MAG: C25 family cysteine peptidase [Bacteroidota bacterium]